MLDKITIVIATKNRHHYLERVIDYYSESGIQILVADATKESYGKTLPGNVTYYHYPEVPYCTKLDDVFKKVNTPYSLMCADDDFIIPTAINTCVEFLDKNPDYSSAQGHYVFFYHSKNKLFYTPAYLSTIGSDFNEDKASDRIKKFNNLGIQFYYCVQKTETLKKVFSIASNKLYSLNLVELLMGMITMINGKHKVLPVFYSVREVLYGSAGKSHGLNVMAVSAEYKEQYQAFFSGVANFLSTTDNVTVEQASSFLNQSIDAHIKYRYNNKFSLKESIIKLAKKTVPFTIRKRARHYFLLLIENNKHKKNLALTSKARGYPFLEGPDKKELQRIESYIFKYNIQ